MSNFSVILCTYNPVQAILERCLTAITKASKQSMPEEIIIIDNNSTIPLTDQNYIQSFLQEHRNAKVVVEKQQGLTPARLRGIKESSAALLVFVDDDNIIAEDFFAKGILIAAKHTLIGAWSGQVKLEFEKQPEPWTRPYWGLLVHREFNKDLWSNLPHLAETMPCGAGLFIRKVVADYYYNLHLQGKRAIQLDRNGKSLFSGGDNDMAACACDIGLGVGLFHEIIVNHHIPAFRVEKSYLLKLAEGIAASSIVFRSFRNEYPQQLSLKNKVANYLRLVMKDPVDKDFYNAVLRGEEQGRKLLQEGGVG